MHLAECQARAKLMPSFGVNGGAVNTKYAGNDADSLPNAPLIGCSTQPVMVKNLLITGRVG